MKNKFIITGIFYSLLHASAAFGTEYYPEYTIIHERQNDNHFIEVACYSTSSRSKQNDQKNILKYSLIEKSLPKWFFWSEVTERYLTHNGDPNKKIPLLSGTLAIKNGNISSTEGNPPSNAVCPLEYRDANNKLITRKVLIEHNKWQWEPGKYNSRLQPHQQILQLKDEKSSTFIYIEKMKYLPLYDQEKYQHISIAIFWLSILAYLYHYYSTHTITISITTI